MVTKQPRLLKADRAHFAKVQAAVIGSFNFWAKSKAKPQYVRRLASEIARDAVADWYELSKRTERNGK
jgi:hypothetical protein